MADEYFENRSIATIINSFFRLESNMGPARFMCNSSFTPDNSDKGSAELNDFDVLRFFPYAEHDL